MEILTAMKKLFPLLFLLAFALILGGATLKIDVTIVGEECVSGSYSVDGRTALKVLLRYGGSYQAFFDEEGEKTEVADLSAISGELSRDLKDAIEREKRQPVDGEIIWENCKFSYKEGRDGKDVDTANIAKEFYGSYGKSVTIRLKTFALPHRQAMAEMRDKTAEIGTFSTVYGSSSAGRKSNIALATKRISGSVIEPFSSYSFNYAVGKRSVENGFSIAKIISNGKFVDGVGGGVCQVSSTLYNTALLSGLSVISHVNHSLPVSYVSPSFDAMVSASADLVIYNDTEENVYIKGECDGYAVRFTFYGQKTPYSYRLRSELVRVLPCDEYEEYPDEIDDWGDETERIFAYPKNGMITAGYRDTYLGEKLVRTEKLGVYVYRAQKGIKATRAKAAPSL